MQPWIHCSSLPPLLHHHHLNATFLLHTFLIQMLNSHPPLSHLEWIQNLYCWRLYPDPHVLFGDEM